MNITNEDASEVMEYFWKTLDLLIKVGSIESGWEYKIEMREQVTLMVPDAKRAELGGDRCLVSMPEPKLLLFIRMHILYPHYITALKKQGSNVLPSIELIVKSIKQSEYYIGMVVATSFEKGLIGHKMSSAYVVDYELLRKAIGRETLLSTNLPDREKVEWPVKEVKLESWKELLTHDRSH